jgi:hypothetical protein
VSQHCGLDLGLLQHVRWRMSLHGLEQPQLRKRDDRCGFPA